MVGVFCVFCASWRPTLRHPPGAIRGHPDMGWKAHATWHGLSSPWVWGGPYALRPPSSDHSVPSCQKFFRVFRVFRGPTLRCPSSVVRRPSSALRHPTDSCAFCASLRPIHRQPSVICPPPSVVRRQPSHPILARFAPLGGQPSVIPPPVAFSTRTFPREKRFCQLQNNHPRPRSFVCYSPEFLRGP